MGKTVFFLPSCHSTNDVALSYFQQEKLFEGDLVITANQVAGKGQRGNSWESEPEKNLTFSLLLKPTFLVAFEQFNLNICISLSINNCLKKFSPYFEVKWPNDIYHGEKKLCGILIQNNLIKNTISSSVVGIGLNVNQKVFESPKATSLRNITGTEIDIDKLFEDLIIEIEKNYMKLKRGKLDVLKTEYLANLYWFSEEHLFKSENGTVFTGRITGITSGGKLLIDTNSGCEQFDMKQVEFLK